MKVKELIEILNECDEENEVYCGESADNLINSERVVNVMEVHAKYRIEDEVETGVYLRVE